MIQAMEKVGLNRAVEKVGLIQTVERVGLIQAVERVGWVGLNQAESASHPSSTLCLPSLPQHPQ